MGCPICVAVCPCLVYTRRAAALGATSGRCYMHLDARRFATSCLQAAAQQLLGAGGRAVLAQKVAHYVAQAHGAKLFLQFLQCGPICTLQPNGPV